MADAIFSRLRPIYQRLEYQKRNNNHSEHTSMCICSWHYFYLEFISFMQRNLVFYCLFVVIVGQCEH